MLSNPSALDKPASRIRLEFLDGLRGLAALYVVIHHAFMMVAWKGESTGLPRLLRHATNWLYFGQAAVDVFIVLSGFVLMLPVARSRALSGGVAGFFTRRAHRILPPYYAALALCWLPSLSSPAYTTTGARAGMSYFRLSA